MAVVSTTIPGAILRRALVQEAPPTPPAMMLDADLDRVLIALEEAGYLIVSRADVHALRAAADKVLRFTPAQSTWCGVKGCALHGVRDHGHQGGSPTPTR
jgi:hypothetical protein